MPRTLIAIVTAALLAAACTGADPDTDPSLPPSPADASTEESAASSGEESAEEPGEDSGGADRVPDITDSAELSEPVVARGVVTRADGSPVADAQVTLAVRPDPGDAAALTPVAKARTGSDGGYELRIAAEQRSGLSADPDGVIEYEIGVETPDGVASYAWSGPPELTHPQTADLELAETPR